MQIHITQGKITCISKSESGQIEESSPIDYDGDNFTFQTNPEHIKQIVDQDLGMIIGDNRLSFKTKDFQYVVALIGE